MVGLAFAQINYQAISSGISRLMSPTADFSITSYPTPQTLPSGFLYSLNPASDYYVATSVDLSTNTPYIGNPFYFSVSFNNKGKNSVSDPYIVIYLADAFSREWASWNRSLAESEFSHGFSLAYNFPTLDRKTTGAWFVWALLYDNATGQLVSVNSTEFTATDIAPLAAWIVDLLVILVAGMFIFAVVVSVRRYIKDRKKAQARKAKRAEKEANVLK
jgi:hypothetical protein